MKQLGNLAIICALRSDILLQIQGARISLHLGEGPQKKHLALNWDDDTTISKIINEINFGKYKQRRE